MGPALIGRVVAVPEGRGKAPPATGGGGVCACVLRGSPFALSVPVGAEGPAEVLVHHAAYVTLEVREQHTARAQVFRLRGLHLLFVALV